MPKFIVKNGSLKFNGTLYPPDSTVEMSEAQAAQALAAKTIEPITAPKGKKGE